MLNGTHNNETSRQAMDAHQRHDRFLASLERHGGSTTRRTWSNMASELDWTVEEVQTYAYRYMTALSTDQSTQEEQEHNGGNESTNGDAWTLEENILFDSLLAVYLPNGIDSSTNRLDWEEHVAAHLPGRTPMQVRRRYNSRYVEEHTQETGESENTNNLVALNADVSTQDEPRHQRPLSGGRDDTQCRVAHAKK